MSIQTIEACSLDLVTGGVAAPSPQQQQLRTMAAQYCPATYAQNKSAPVLTRQMGEKCLDEAGYGMFKGQLDQYFPRK